MPDSPLRAALLAQLGRRPAIALRRVLAAELRALADEQERIIEAEQRQFAKPAGERLTPRTAHAGPGRAPSMFVRVAREQHGDYERLHVYVGRGLYYQLGSPARLDVQRLGGRLRLTPADGGQGYAVQVGKGMPRFFADGARDILDLEDGRYAGAIEGGAIVIGGAL